MHFKCLRDLLIHLEANGKLHHVTHEVNKDWEIAAITRHAMRQPEAERYAIQFDNIKGFSTPVVTGSLGASREIYAMALGVATKDGRVDKDAIHARWVEALNNPVAPTLVATGPCKENIATGDEIDVTAFPVPTWTATKDIGPYLSAGAVIQKDPDTGIQNCGVYRAMIQAPDRVGMLVQAAKHAGIIFDKYDSLGQTMEVAIAIGTPPAVGMTSVGRIPYGVDELTVAGALAGAPIEVVKGETVDLLVPAHAEMIIEGVVKPGMRADEGPFGEFFGYMGPRATAPVIKITAISYRHGTIHQGFQEQMPPSEGSCIKDIAMESVLLAALRGNGIAGVLDVHVHPMSCQSHIAVKIRPQFPAHARAVMNGCWATYPNRCKRVIVVEEDCDIYDDNDIEWHVATRVQPQRDVVLWKDATGIMLDPSMPRAEAVWGSKMGVDATKSVEYPEQSLPPLEHLDEVKEHWSRYGLPGLG